MGQHKHGVIDAGIREVHVKMYWMAWTVLFLLGTFLSCSNKGEAEKAPPAPSTPSADNAGDEHKSVRLSVTDHFQFIGKINLETVSPPPSQEPIKAKNPTNRPALGKDAKWLDIYDRAGLPDISDCTWVINVRTSRNQSSEPQTEDTPYWLCPDGTIVHPLETGFIRADRRRQIQQQPSPIWYVADPSEWGARNFGLERYVQSTPKPADYSAHLRDEIKKEKKRQQNPEQQYQNNFDFAPVYPPFAWVIRARWAQMKGNKQLAAQALALARGAFPDVRVSGDPEEYRIKRLEQGAAELLLRMVNEGAMLWKPRWQLVKQLQAATTMGDKQAYWLPKEIHRLKDGLLRAEAQDGAIEKQLQKGNLPEPLEVLLLALRDNDNPFCYDYEKEQKNLSAYIVLPASDGSNRIALPECPGDRIVAMGRGVIPKLLPYLREPTITRAMKPFTNNTSLNVCTLGDQITAVIAKMADLEIGSQEDAPARVLRWWADVNGYRLFDADMAEAMKAEGNNPEALIDVFFSNWEKQITWDDVTFMYENMRYSGLRNALLQNVAKTLKDQKQFKAFAMKIAFEDESYGVRKTAGEILATEGIDITPIVALRAVKENPSNRRNWWHNGKGVRKWVTDEMKEGLTLMATEVSKCNLWAIESLSDGLDDRCPLSRGDAQCVLSKSSETLLLNALANCEGHVGPGAEWYAYPSLRNKVGRLFRKISTGWKYTGKSDWVEEQEGMIAINHFLEKQGRKPIQATDLFPPEEGQEKPTLELFNMSDTVAAVEVAEEWIKGLREKTLDFAKESVRFFKYAAAHPDYAFYLRVVRFPYGPVTRVFFEARPQSPVDSATRIISWDVPTTADHKKLPREQFSSFDLSGEMHWAYDEWNKAFDTAQSFEMLVEWSQCKEFDWRWEKIQ